MIKRIKTIKDIGRFINVGNKPLGKITLIYGPNCIGKSTLTDILRSLQAGDPKPIQMRLSIGKENSNAHTEFTFSENYNSTEKCISFNNTWDNPSPQFIKIFDSKFIEQNVFTGLTITRENKENLTNLILGQSSVLIAQNIKELKQNLLSTTKELTQLEDSLKKTLGQSDLGVTLDEFLKTIKDIEIEKLKLDRQKLATDINEYQRKLKNKDLILQLNQLNILPTFSVEKVVNQINETLQSSYDEINETSFQIIEVHIKKHAPTKEDTFVNWIKRGNSDYLNIKGKENSKCPFCSQSLENVSELIDAYNNVFNLELQNYETRITHQLYNIDSLFRELEDSLDTISKRGLTNAVQRNKIDSYTKHEDYENTQEVQGEDSNLEKSIKNVNEHLSSYKEKWNAVRDIKSAKIFKKVEELNPTEHLTQAIASLNKLINDYNLNTEQVNSNLNSLKEMVNNSEASTPLDEYKKKLAVLEVKIKRYELDSDVISITNKRAEKHNAETKIKNLQAELEKQNKSYIENYFSEVTKSFQNYGSVDFNIKPTYRIRGNQPIYEPTIEFMNEEITEDKLPYIFSEADRRALGFSIFLTEVDRMDKSDKEKTIVILDDPVTSFDTNRSSKTCQSILKFVREFDQIIILTHSGNFYLEIYDLLKKDNSDLVAYEILRKETTNDIQILEKPKARFNAHTKELENIERFIQAKDINQTSTVRRALRPFLQSELEWRYSKQLNNLTINGLGELVDIIYNKQLINEDLKNEILDVVKILNSDHHEDEQAYMEDTRSMAIQVLNIVYEKMNPKK